MGVRTKRSLFSFHVFGIEVRPHWSLLAAAALFAWYSIELTNGILPARHAALIGLIQAFVLFAIVLLHELGHCLGAWKLGLSVGHILLTPLGGTAVLDEAMVSPEVEMEVSFFGPVVNMLLMLFSFPLLSAFGLPLSGYSPAGRLGGIPSFFFLANVALALFNLIPAYPMDGGRLLRAVLAMRSGEKKGTLQATGIGMAMGVILVAGGLMVALSSRNPWGWILVGIGVSNLIVCWRTRAAIAAGARVYSSWRSAGARRGGPSWEMQNTELRKDIEERRREREEERKVRERVDSLLEKVSREGIGALSEEERTFLKQASRRFRS